MTSRSEEVWVMVHRVPAQGSSGWKAENSSQHFRRLGIDWLFTNCVILGHLFDLLKPSFHHLSKGIKIIASSWYSRKD